MTVFVILVTSNHFEGNWIYKEIADAVQSKTDPNSAFQIHYIPENVGQNSYMEHVALNIKLTDLRLDLVLNS